MIVVELVGGGHFNHIKVNDMFTANQFTTTQWDSADDKAKFAKQFIKFVKSGFEQRHFTDRFYRRLSNTFSHIAHYDRGGFWQEFFTTTADKVRFLELTLKHPCYGDPAWTYSDVERAIQDWLKQKGILAKWQRQLHQELEASERAEFERLQAKFT
jgi:hypothetical protein